MPEVQSRQRNTPTHSGNRGKLIVFEGIDGSGKSTQCQALKAFLKDNGINAITSFEPTNGPHGTKIRSLAMEGKRLPADEELDLFLQDRQEHLDQLILPTLEKGDWVILDRYYFSTLAYQSLNGFTIEALRQKNEAFAPQPDLLIILQLTPQISLERIAARNEGTTAFEKVDLLTHCANVFNSLESEPFAHLINADQSIESITQNIQQEIQTRFQLNA